MKHFLRKLIVEATVDTPLEYGLRAVYRGLSRSQNVKYDRELIEVLRRSLRKTSNCVDVGCYRGDILRQMVKFAPRAITSRLNRFPRIFGISPGHSQAFACSTWR